MINLPSFAFQQYIDKPKSESDARADNLSHTGAQRSIEGLSFGFMMPVRPALKAHPARALNTNLIPINKMADELSVLRRP